MLQRSTILRRRVGVAVAVVSLFGVLTAYLLSPLNPNVRYESGVKTVSGWSAVETFSHRPLAFRVLMDGVFTLARTFSFGVASYEVMVRLVCLLMAAGAAVLLTVGLARHGVPRPGLHAAVAAASVVLVGVASTAEPDWMAVVLSIAGTGAALAGGGRLRWVWAALAGVLLVAAAAMKIVTLPTALVGLLVVGLLDRRQALRTVVACGVVGLAYVAGTVLWLPWEITSLLDVRTVQPTVAASLADAVPFVAESAARWPAIALLPAALLLAPARERLALLAAVLLAVVPVVAQGQYFAYHGVPLCVVATVAVFAVLRTRLTTTSGWAVLAVVLAASALTATTARWRTDQRITWELGTAAVLVAALAWAWWVRRRPPARGPLTALLAALAAVALMFPVMTPFSAQLVRAGTPTKPGPATVLETRSQQERTAREVRRRIGGIDEPVTYLTFGDWTYFVRNPTACRYPSPLFLQRTRYSSGPVGTPSYQENLACLRDPTAGWLVWDRSWFRLDLTPREVQDAVAAGWACDRSFRVRQLTVCPRRAG